MFACTTAVVSQSLWPSVPMAMCLNLLATAWNNVRTDMIVFMVHAASNREDLPLLLSRAAKWWVPVLLDTPSLEQILEKCPKSRKLPIPYPQCQLSQGAKARVTTRPHPSPVKLHRIIRAVQLLRWPRSHVPCVQMAQQLSLHALPMMNVPMRVSC